MTANVFLIVLDVLRSPIAEVHNQQPSTYQKRYTVLISRILKQCEERERAVRKFLRVKNAAVRYVQWLHGDLIMSVISHRRSTNTSRRRSFQKFEIIACRKVSLYSGILCTCEKRKDVRRGWLSEVASGAAERAIAAAPLSLWATACNSRIREEVSLGELSLL